MRILHVVASLAPRYGGPSTAVPQLCSALVARNHYVELFTTDRDGTERLSVRKNSTQWVSGVGTTYFSSTRPRAYAASPAMGRELVQRVSDFDAVHVHGLYLFHGLVACASARRHGIPYFVQPHGALNPYLHSVRRGRKVAYTWLVERRNLELACGVHCTSEEERRHVGEAFPHARPFVVPLGVCPPVLSGVEVRLPRLKGKRLVTFLGRLTTGKRPVLVVEAFARVVREHEDAHLVIAGSDDHSLGAVVVARARELGIVNRVSLLGMLAHTDAWVLLARSSAFVLPSVGESFGIAVVEAMSSGVPVVVTEGVALHREVSAHKAGIVVESSAESIAEAICRILGRPDEAAQMGASGRLLAQTAFDWSVVAERLEVIYAEAAA
jgi:glycosyltransferase involved in cell wall biosynthesis